jgi:hypothetical protein
MSIKLRETDGRREVFDMVRNRFVALTPEEWVRQHFIQYLHEVLLYPVELMQVEGAISLNGMTRRCDTVLYAQEGLVPRMIIEYKRPDIALTQHVFDQICRYNMVLHVPYLIVSNGLEHYCCRIDYETNGYVFLEDIPAYDEL